MDVKDVVMFRSQASLQAGDKARLNGSGFFGGPAYKNRTSTKARQHAWVGFILQASEWAGPESFLSRHFDENAQKHSTQLPGPEGTATMDHLVELFYAKFATDVARWQAGGRTTVPVVGAFGPGSAGSTMEH